MRLSCWPLLAAILVGRSPFQTCLIFTSQRLDGSCGAHFKEDWPPVGFLVWSDCRTINNRKPDVRTHRITSYERWNGHWWIIDQSRAFSENPTINISLICLKTETWKARVPFIFFLIRNETAQWEGGREMLVFWENSSAGIIDTINRDSSKLWWTLYNKNNRRLSAGAFCIIGYIQWNTKPVRIIISGVHY